MNKKLIFIFPVFLIALPLISAAGFLRQGQVVPLAASTLSFYIVFILFFILLINKRFLVTIHRKSKTIQVIKPKLYDNLNEATKKRSL